MIADTQYSLISHFIIIASSVSFTGLSPSRA